MESPNRAGTVASLPNSLWAALCDTRPSFPELRGTHTCSTVVVGAGFMGLALALKLAENDNEVIVIEAATVGWGASGRNNGLLAAGLKRDPHEVRRMLGAEQAERLLRFSGAAPQLVFDLCDRHAIQCDLNRRGWIQAAHSARALPMIERRVADWRELGADAQIISRHQVAERLGTEFYAGAWHDPRGGSLNPLAFALGLAKAARAAGASIFEASPAISAERQNGRWTVRTPAAKISCDHVVWCTNAYNSNNGELRGTVMPLRTAQIASVPLPDELLATVLPGGESCSDTQRLLTSFRVTADRRLIMGGTSATAGDEHAGLFARLHRAAQLRFPRLAGIEWAFGWSGYLALTPTHLPHVLSLGRGCYAGVGCNGRGIAMATATGAAIGDLICGQDESDCSVPVQAPKRFFGYGLRHIGVAVGVHLQRFLDTAERRLFS